MKDIDRYSQYEKMGKHFPEESQGSSSSSEETMTLAAQSRSKIRHRVLGAIVLLLTVGALGTLVFDEAPSGSAKQADSSIPPLKQEQENRMELVVDSVASNGPVSAAPASGLGLGVLDQQQDLSKVNPNGKPLMAAPHDDVIADKESVDQKGAFYIQVLATSSEAGAMKAMERYQALGFPVYSLKIQKKSVTLWRVRLGLFNTKADAIEAVNYLDRRQITHLGIKEDKTMISKPDQKAPLESKPVAKKVEQSAQKSPVKENKPVQKPIAVKKTVKKEVSTAKSAVKKTSPKNVVRTTKTTAKSPDPLADTLKAVQKQDRNASRDFIAEQIARERK